MKVEVYKHNSIIGTGLTLSLQEERYLQVCLGSVYKKESLRDDIFYEVNVVDYAERCGLTLKHAYKDMKAISISLLKAVVGIEQKDGSVLHIGLAHKVLSNDGIYTISIKWNKEVIPLISGFRHGNYTVLPQESTRLSSINTHNLYQILKRWA